MPLWHGKTRARGTAHMCPCPSGKTAKSPENPKTRHVPACCKNTGFCVCRGYPALGAVPVKNPVPPRHGCMCRAAYVPALLVPVCYYCAVCAYYCCAATTMTCVLCHDQYAAWMTMLELSADL